VDVSLTPDLEELVKRKVDSRAYSTATDVVRDALELLEERNARKLEMRSGMTFNMPSIRLKAVSGG